MWVGVRSDAFTKRGERLHAMSEASSVPDTQTQPPDSRLQTLVGLVGQAASTDS